MKPCKGCKLNKRSWLICPIAYLRACLNCAARAQHRQHRLTRDAVNQSTDMTGWCRIKITDTTKSQLGRSTPRTLMGLMPEPVANSSTVG